MHGFLDEVRAAYDVPPRAYHNWSHIERVLEHYESVKASLGWRQPEEVRMAVLLHDAIYVAGAKDNEARSAVLAVDIIGRWYPDHEIDRARVAALIQLTARHGHLESNHVDGDEALFLDCDMAVLGASEEEFARYDAGVAAEYASAVTPEAYRAGRRAFLAALLARPRIFLSDFFHVRCDLIARQNLAKAMTHL
jgi:predicted metal-dependent HD superfamily phosphohydrolase